MAKVERSFEAWKKAARDYALEQLDLWEFQIQALASDFAWRNEGIPITKENLDGAYADWISGRNPYSVHTIHLDGYDKKGKWERDARDCKEKLHEFALESGFDEVQAIRFVRDVELERGIGISYVREREFQQRMKEWINGKNRYSPHHVPLSPEHILNRQERWDEIRGYYPEKEDWEFDLLMDRGLLGTDMDI